MTDTTRLAQILYDHAFASNESLFTGYPLMTYGDLMDALDWNRFRLQRALEAAVERDHNLERPYFSSLVVSKRTGVPGDGFWTCLKERCNIVIPQDRQIHWWRREVGRVMGFACGVSFSGPIP